MIPQVAQQPPLSVNWHHALSGKLFTTQIFLCQITYLIEMLIQRLEFSYSNCSQFLGLSFDFSTHFMSFSRYHLWQQRPCQTHFLVVACFTLCTKDLNPNLSFEYHVKFTPKKISQDPQQIYFPTSNQTWMVH
jgi:hypothetical protein